MKKTLIALLSVGALLLTSCATTKTNSNGKSGNIKIEARRAYISNVDMEGGVQYGKSVDGYDNVTVLTGSKSTGRNIVSVDLEQFADSEIDLSFSCDVKVVDSTGADTDVIWMVNEINQGMPQLAREKVKSGEWVHFSGSKTLDLSGKRQFYFSGAGIDKENITVYIRNFNMVLTGDSIGVEKIAQPNWRKEESLAVAYKDYFDYIGFATPLNGVLNNAEVQEGLEHQASCFTMENEFKPDFVFAWQKPANYKEFTGENGKTIKVPTNTPPMNSVGGILGIAKSLNLKMRGHVLVWHAQTPDWFFRENYGSNKEAFVDKDTMNVRLEWYIKTVLEYVKNWEDKYNDGERIVITWDVVNEAASDNSSASQWLRTESNWYKIYKSDEFIVNAFRYANKYAPKDVKLAYNDYGCVSPNKSNAICKIVDAIQAAPDARIDVVGMQSHVGMNTPVTGPNSFETSVKKFLAKGVDVQITELDIGQDGQKYNSEALKAKYKAFFKMFLANRKTADKNGICGVTLWGIIDERSWIYNNNGTKQHPLLFDGNYTCKPAFYGVLEAAKEEK